ncbi:hypothetical protein [Methanosarcina barkeri]|uniref:hypothetical protein n=1 Tax=Methanosarcina barkeri TaxID=2208 RepID=UPI000A779CF4|nr:hypothetical protein [Methanosarcina barkeri]
MTLDVRLSGSFILQRKSEMNPEIERKTENNLGRKIIYKMFNCSRKEKNKD